MKHLSNVEIELKTVELIKTERRINADLLLHLREIESRRIFAERGFSSMFEYLVKGHHYSEGAAHRRIMAARALKTFPEIEDSIRNGDISLTTAAMFQTFVKTEKVENPLKLLKSIERLSKRETEKLFASIAPTYIQSPQEKVTAINAADVEIRFIADKSLQEKFDELRNLFSHTDPKLDYRKLFHLMADRLLVKSRRKRFYKKSADKLSLNNTILNIRSDDETPPAGFKCVKPECETELPITHRTDLGTPEIKVIKEKTVKMQKNIESKTTSLSSNLFLKQNRSRYIPTEVRQDIFQRDGYACTYEDVKTGRKCESKFQLELDHIVPYSCGGNHTKRKSTASMCLSQ